MSENKPRTRAETAMPQPRKSNVFIFVIALAAVLLLGLGAKGFLNSQKLHRQVVALQRQLAALEKRGQQTDLRVAELARELAVQAVRRQQAQIRQARRALYRLKPMFKENPGLAGAVSRMQAELKRIDVKLTRKLGAQPKSPIAAPCTQGANGNRLRSHLECRDGICRLSPVPHHQSPSDRLKLELSGSKGAAVPQADAGVADTVAAHSAPANTAPAAESTWWSRFINWRIFGGN